MIRKASLDDLKRIIEITQDLKFDDFKKYFSME